MNTVEELVSVYNIHENNAKMMLDNYSKKIGVVNGDFRITDITYKGFETKDIELTCTLCGKVIHRDFVGGKNKWSELIKNCDCKKLESEKILKNKKATRNDDESLLGNVYGSWEVKDFVRIPHKNKSGSTVKWLCKCKECGTEKIMIPSNIKSGQNLCTCQKETQEIENKRDEQIGKKYNRLTIIDFKHKQPGKTKRIYAVCLCDCGNVKEIQPRCVIDGTIKSCGCYAEEIRQKQRDSEKRTSSPLYRTWNSMKQRCSNPNNPGYINYGERGITVCDEWLGYEGFNRFEEWSIRNGYRPNNGLSLDRINVNDGYTPSNCRWVSVWVQSVNKRVPAHEQSVKFRGKQYTINGITKNKKQWCEEYGVWQATVDYRMKKMGMSLEEALKAEKINEGNHHPKILDIHPDKKKALEDINKINSYIECNLYMKFTETTNKYILQPQYKIDNCKADFWVVGTNILVECDGYDYHKTKEQIAGDCNRQRKFMKLGYDVIRFSGTEINSNCEKCVNELIEIIESRGWGNESKREAN